LQSVNTSKWLTLVWGVIAIIFALSAQLVENLIEAVNILGSVFYGTILGVFLTAFFLKKVGAKAVLVGIVIGQLTVFLLFYNETVGYLWFNVIGCAIVMIVSYVISIMSNNPNQG
jgi:SSS family solute:Na+ symporter